MAASSSLASPASTAVCEARRCFSSAIVAGGDPSDILDDRSQARSTVKQQPPKIWEGEADREMLLTAINKTHDRTRYLSYRARTIRRPSPHSLSNLVFSVTTDNELQPRSTPAAQILEIGEPRLGSLQSSKSPLSGHGVEYLPRYVQHGLAG